MAAERTYLEFSEEIGVSHKFYEITVEDTQVTIRFGRIGTDGQTTVKTYPSPAKAKAEAEKKIREKRNKGYEPAIMGVRQKRSLTRRHIESQKSTAKQAPILWKFQSGAPAFGIFIDAHHCWVGNQNGSLFVLNHEGQVLTQYRLRDGVKCIMADGDWIYAGCDDGCVYDLTGKLPRIAYEIAENVDIFWLDICDALLGVSDREGTIMIADHDNEALWMKKSEGWSGWMVRCDKSMIYHGHSEGVTAYQHRGRGQPLATWSYKTTGNVLFGWQEKTTVYASTSNGKVYMLNKADGKMLHTYQCEGGVFSCAATEDGQYVFAGDNFSSIYCFNRAGERLWKLATGCGSAFSMQYLNKHLYIVTTEGILACIDASETAIQAAKTGIIPHSKDIKAPQPMAVSSSTELENVTNPTEGVLLKCVREGNKLRIKVISSILKCKQEGGKLKIEISPEYHQEWNVQFPRNIREEGALYVVDEVREAERGGFYRVFGNIRRLKR